MTTTKLLGLGTAAIGRPQYINIKQDKSAAINMAIFKQNGIAVLNEAYAKGIRYFDTAPGYGMAEELLIDWLKEKNAPAIEVATKWGYTYVANFNAAATEHEVKEHSLGKLTEQWKQSKQLLPYLTTYQIHSATFESGVLENEEVLQKLFELKTQYHLKIGLTTTGNNQAAVLQKALTIQQDGEGLFDVFQCTYNILEQSIFSVLELLSNKRLIIKEALANGRLFPNKAYPHYSVLYTVLTGLSIKYKVGIDAIALRFCIDSLQPYTVLSGASTVNQLSENSLSLDFSLSTEDLELLKSYTVLSDAYWNERKQLSWQ